MDTPENPSDPVQICWSEPERRLEPLSTAKAREWLAELDGRLREEGSHLRDIMLRRPALLASILCQSPGERIQALIKATSESGRTATGEAELMVSLRRAKQETALLCGLADLGGWWHGPQVTEALTDFADAALSATCDHLLLALHEAGKVTLPDTGRPQAGCGLIVLGMGKYGSHELNYSSDIDLILFFERRAMKINTDDATTLFSRFAKSLVRIMQERTGDGYVFRVDLRLRPDPGSTPPAIPVETALNYYEAYGQNWERAAMIKARPVAGDIEAGAYFLKELAPFIWRKYLDYAAIQDVHSIKRQIHAHRGHGEIAVGGHNIKLGRGGIREIEFFAQTQQLIAGGRLPQLRKLRTVDALAALEAEGWIDAAARDELSASYWYLRDVEHRIQMIADEQSHTLPDDKKGLTRIALMMGEKDARRFSEHLTKTLKTVERHYAGLFEMAPELTSGGNLVFTGDDDDPATVETLSAMGFSRPSEVIRSVRGWHFGRFPAVRTAQARELLTELTPSLLEAIAGAGDADRTFAAFDRFLGGLPAGIQLFSLLKSNPNLLRLLLLILSAAPRLAETITRRPHVFDAMLEPAFASAMPGQAALAQRLAGALDRASHYEAMLDAARVFAAEQRFLIGARLISGALAPAAAARAFADLAEVMVRAMLERVTREFETRHGKVPGGDICVLGMGRLGSRELTAGSDLDLILLYDHDPDAEYSDGPKPLAASHYFIRLTQRLIAAMSAPTAEGVIYPLDFRLRPSGNAGPLATPLSAFVRYQQEEAWTWERQALTRARVVAGQAGFAGRVEEAVRELLARPCDPAKLSADVKEMRDLVAKEKATSNPFEVKTVRGGLVDVEFIAQWTVLKSGSGGRPGHPTATIDMLKSAVDLTAADQDALVSACMFQTDVQQVLRLCMEEPFVPGDAPLGLAAIICDTLDMPDIRTVEGALKEHQRTVREIFARVIG
ncbi:MAG: bifunctional [glutamine synthetase] adenylyltransferase/[glutamine synthetase]-adenylyl-L-tyrosine phosphorylase [Nitratireductor sp.]|nr:bifunctional [glutamine synthetase] adenylyltransferase/[glutamine synthetase]-adenylyl-L-tyrosine phosphorylase [Nitratireductor sp.]